jgi:hypothetical protein
MDITKQKLIFVTGASRSGTTLLSFVLRNHSKVMGLKELQFFGDYWDPRRGSIELGRDRAVAAVAMMLARQAQGVLAANPGQAELTRAAAIVRDLGPDGADPAALFAATVATLSEDAGKAIPCEQTPRNIYYAQALLDIYPNSRIVHMMRDPRAVMASQKQRWMRRKLTTDAASYPRSRTLRAWVNYHPFTVSKLWNRASQRAQQLQRHARFCVLRFEDLIEDPETQLRQLCERLGLAFEPAMLEIGQVNSSHASSVGGARRGFNPAAIEAWRDKLTGAEIEATERRCRPLMDSFGYTRRASHGSRLLGNAWMGLTYVFHLAGVLLLNPRRAWIQFRGLSREPGVSDGVGQGRAG